MFQRYSIARESISPRMPGKLVLGKPLIAMIRMCLRPIHGSTPPQKSSDARISFR